MASDEIKKIEKETIRLFDIYHNNSGRQEFAEHVKEDIEFVNNAQWDESDAQALEDNNMPAVCYNEMKPARDQVVQQMTENRPQYLAVGRENSDVKLGGDLSDFMGWIWDESRGNLKFIKGVENFEDMGLLVFHPYFDSYADKGNGEIRIRCIDPRDWYPDPRSQDRDAQDSENQFLGYVLSKGTIQRTYPDFDFKEATPYRGDLRTYSSNRADQGQKFDLEFLQDQEYYRVIDRYQKIKVPRYKVTDPNSQFEEEFTLEEYIQFANQPALIANRVGAQRGIIKESEVSLWINNIQQYNTNIFHMMSDGQFMPGVEHGGASVGQNGQLIMAVPGSTIKIDVVKTEQLLREGLLEWKKIFVDKIERTLLIGDKLYRKVVTPHSRYPFAVTMLHHTGTPFPYGDARLTKPIQEQINKTRSIITAYNINIASLKVFVPEGTDTKQLEDKWGKAGAQFFTYDPELGGPPIVMQFQQMANALYDQLDRDKYLIQRIYGAYEFADGAVTKAPETKGGTILVDQFAQRRSGFKLKFIEEALNDLGYLVAEMIPKVYTKKKIVRIVRPNQRGKELVFNDGREETDLTINQYDFKMVSGSTLPTHRGARLDMAIQLWDRGIHRDNSAILRLTDLPDVEEIIAKNDALAAAENAINQMQEVIKTMEGDAQTAERELRHADRQIEKEKAKTKMNELLSNLKAATNVATQRINDLAKTRKSETKASEGAKTS